MNSRPRFCSPPRTAKLVFNVTQNDLSGLKSVDFGCALPPYLRVFERDQCSDVGVSLSSMSAMCRKPYKILYNLSRHLSVFYTSDKYNDINVISDSLSYDADLFRQQCLMLRDFHRALNLDNIVRLRIPVHRVLYVQISYDVGFACQQVSFQRFFMMIFCKRSMLKDLDEHGTHNLSVSCLCWDERFQHLAVVKELNGHVWKFVSGSVRVHERYVECCIREMYEETSLNVRHLSTFALHESTHFVQNKSKLHVFCVTTTNLATVNPNSNMIYHNNMDVPLCYLNCDVDGGGNQIVSNPHELSGARWVTPRQLLDDELPFSTLDRHVAALMLVRFVQHWALHDCDVDRRYRSCLAQRGNRALPQRVDLCDFPFGEEPHVELLRQALLPEFEDVLLAALDVLLRPEQGARNVLQPPRADQQLLGGRSEPDRMLSDVQMDNRINLLF